MDRPSPVQRIIICSYHSQDRARRQHSKYAPNESIGRVRRLTIPDFLTDVHSKPLHRGELVNGSRPIKSDTTIRRRIVSAYAALPVTSTDEATIQAYKCFRREIYKQFNFLTRTLGVHVIVSRYDPYPSAESMVADLNERRRLLVYATAATGEHPYLTHDENDMFRALHDVFGHAATGRGFDTDGEEVAWFAHAKMFSISARAAMTTDTRGQSSWLIERGKFPIQKMGLLPPVFCSFASLCSCSPSVDYFDARAECFGRGRRSTLVYPRFHLL
jgi:hypothetical protein